jgi:hypothetical protein
MTERLQSSGTQDRHALREIASPDKSCHASNPFGTSHMGNDRNIRYIFGKLARFPLPGYAPESLP